MKKLYRSNSDRKICGVCGGIAEYLNIDSGIVRILCVFLIFAAGTGLLAYIIAAIVIPENPEHMKIITNGKKLYRSKHNKMICGVCGGIAEYLNIDVTIVRLLWLASILCFGTGFIAYFVIALVIPEE